MAISRKRQADAPPLPDGAPQPEEEYTGPGARAVVGEPVIDSDLVETTEDDLIAEETGEPMVYYIGQFGRREISVQDWQRAHVADQPAVSWTRANNFAVPQSAFHDIALNVLRQDSDFRFA